MKKNKNKFNYRLLWLIPVFLFYRWWAFGHGNTGLIHYNGFFGLGIFKK